MSRLGKRWFGLVALILLLAVPLALVLSRAFGTVVRDLVAVPLLYVAWLGRLYVRTVPRAFLWAGLLLFGFLLAVVSGLAAASDRGKRRPHPGCGTKTTGPYDAPVRRLVLQIQAAERSAYSRKRLGRRLGGLALQVLGHREQYRLAEIDRRLDALEAPAEIRRVVAWADQRSPPAARHGFVARLWFRLTGVANKKTMVYDEVEQAVECLEEQLEGV